MTARSFHVRPEPKLSRSASHIRKVNAITIQTTRLSWETLTPPGAVRPWLPALDTPTMKSCMPAQVA